MALEIGELTIIDLQVSLGACSHLIENIEPATSAVATQPLRQGLGHVLQPSFAGVDRDLGPFRARDQQRGQRDGYLVRRPRCEFAKPLERPRDAVHQRARGLTAEGGCGRE